jgi:antitoxin HicB
MPYSRVLVPQPDGGYFAEIIELQGCYAEGETADEALASLDEAMVAWVETARELGQSIPPPFSTQDYSGRIVLRLPKSLHRDAARRAKMEGVSLNQYLVTAIAARLGAEDIVDALADRLAPEPRKPRARMAG